MGLLRYLARRAGSGSSSIVASRMAGRTAFSAAVGLVDGFDRAGAGPPPRATSCLARQELDSRPRIAASEASGRNTSIASSNFRAQEPRRQNADDGESDAVDRELTPQHILRAAEPGLPDARADHRDQSIRSAASHIVGRGDRTTDDGIDAERAKQTPAHVRAFDRIDPTRLGQVELAVVRTMPLRSRRARAGARGSAPTQGWTSLFDRSPPVVEAP